MKTEKPIHICIGVPGAGMAWLFENLRKTSLIFLPCLKIIQYWWARPSSSEIELAVKTHRLIETDQEQLAWLDRWAKNKTPSPDDYLELMRRGDRPSMDISPLYCSMPPREIRIIRETIPVSSKIICFTRNPLDRTLAHIKRQAYLLGNFRGPLSDGILIDMARAENQRGINDYKAISNHWKKEFGHRFKAFSYEDLQADPSGFFQEVLGFLNLGKLRESAKKVQPLAGPDESFIPSFSRRQIDLVADIIMGKAPISAVSHPKSALQRIKSVLTSTERVKPRQPSCQNDRAYECLLRMTENLGDNCEFAFFQRSEGYEPSSLFRWSFSLLPKVIQYLGTPLEVYEKENIRPHTESMILDEGVGVYFHSDLTKIELDGRVKLRDETEGFSETYAVEKEKMDYLARKFVHQVKTKPALYVVKSNNALHRDDVLELFRQLRRYNASHLLLYVSEDDRLFLEQEQEGVYHGTIPKFADYSSADRINRTAWKRLLLAVSNEPDIVERMRLLR